MHPQGRSPFVKAPQGRSPVVKAIAIRTTKSDPTPIHTTKADRHSSRRDKNSLAVADWISFIHTGRPDALLRLARETPEAEAKKCLQALFALGGTHCESKGSVLVGGISI